MADIADADHPVRAAAGQIRLGVLLVVHLHGAAFPALAALGLLGQHGGADGRPERAIQVLAVAAESQLRQDSIPAYVMVQLGVLK